MVLYSPAMAALVLIDACSRDFRPRQGQEVIQEQQHFGRPDFGGSSPSATTRDERQSPREREDISQHKTTRFCFETGCVFRFTCRLRDACSLSSFPERNADLFSGHAINIYITCVSHSCLRCRCATRCRAPSRIISGIQRNRAHDRPGAQCRNLLSQRQTRQADDRCQPDHERQTISSV